MNNSINTNNSDILNINNIINFSSLENNISINESKYIDLENTFDNNNINILGLEDSLKFDNSNILQLQSNISNNDSNLSILETSIIINNSNILLIDSQIQSNLSNNNSNINNLKSIVNNLQNSLSINSSNIIDLQNSINNNISNLKNLSISVSINSNNIVNLENNIINNTSLIDNLKNNTSTNSSSLYNYKNSNDFINYININDSNISSIKNIELDQIILESNNYSYTVGSIATNDDFTFLIVGFPYAKQSGYNNAGNVSFYIFDKNIWKYYRNIGYTLFNNYNANTFLGHSVSLNKSATRNSDYIYGVSGSYNEDPNVSFVSLFRLNKSQSYNPDRVSIINASSLGITNDDKYLGKIFLLSNDAHILFIASIKIFL